jgi:hypothetical protein
MNRALICRKIKRSIDLLTCGFLEARAADGFLHYLAQKKSRRLPALWVFFLGTNDLTGPRILYRKLDIGGYTEFRALRS